MCVTASSDTNRLMASASDFSARRILFYGLTRTSFKIIAEATKLKNKS